MVRFQPQPPICPRGGTVDTGDLKSPAYGVPVRIWPGVPLFFLFFMKKSTLNEILIGVLGSKELVEQWWATPNKAFDMEIPDDLLHSNRHNEVVKYIYAQVNGDYY